MAKSLLAEALKKGYINADQKQKAEEYRRELNVSEDAAIRDTKILSDEQITELYSAQYGYKIEFDPEVEDDTLAKQLKYNQMSQNGFIPVPTEGEKIKILTSRPTELLYAEDIIRDRTGYKGRFEYALISSSVLGSLLEKIFKEETSINTDEIEGDSEFGIPNIYDVSESDSSQVVTLVNKILRDAVENNVSDVHFEPQDDGFYIRCRRDGTLRHEQKFPMSIARQITNRIKTMSNLDVNSSKIIQDGNCRLEIFDKLVDLRVSIIPSVNGENLVIRVLDKNKMSFDVSMLGFSPNDERGFLKLIHRPQGIILLTGPTGSGKSTSLYAALSALNTEDRCIITFEDPVEYRIPGIVQVQINPAMDVTFPQALKSGLRQDIEVALVGEIRDPETAAIAFDAANTGHMVFSTLHTNSAASSILRLVKMGVEPYMVSRSLIAVINQRLAKRICPHCKEEYLLPKDSPYRNVLKCGDKDVRLYRGKGCKKCGGEGYKGRVAILEFLVVNEEIGNLLDNGATTYEIEQAAIRNGMIQIQQDGIDKALRGITTLDEVHRTVFFDEI
ncbi:MAG: type II/IV secretion system protein [Clostridia bacterium]|nr:type II/IV secretion system protein [Clostridia bacterium]